MNKRPRIIYGLDSRPPLGHASVLAAQHVLTMFGATVAVPLLLGPSIGMSQAQIAVLISSVMLCSGIATLIQSTFGSRLPIIQGVSFSFLAAFSAIIAYGVQNNLSPAAIMQLIGGSIIAGSLFEIFIGFTGLVGALRRFLSPVVIGPVITLIGLALYQYGAPKAGVYWPISGLTIVLVIVFSLVLSRHNRFFRIFPILSAITISCALCWALSAAGIFPSGHPANVNLDYVRTAPMFRLNPAEIIFPWGMPRFQLGFIVAVLAGFLASIIESIGDYHACSYMAGGGDPTPRQISRGIGCEGIGCLLTGVLGGFSSTSYSENIGLVGLTRVGSRYVVQIAGAILVLLGLFAKFGAFAATIPEPVVGGLYCAFFGLISAIGIQQFAKADLSSDRNLFIGGFSLFMGLSVPAYFAQPAADQLLAQIPQNLDWLSGMIKSIGNTGMAVAAIIGIVLDNVIPGTLEERGLKVPSPLVPETGDLDADSNRQGASH